MKQLYLILTFFLLVTSCNSQSDKNSRQEKLKETEVTNLLYPLPSPSDQLGEYVRHVFQDRKGNLWIGTMQFGVAKHNGKTLKYFSEKEGLSNNQINGISEDIEGNLWFATGQGVSKYDGDSFTVYKTDEGLSHNSTWSILADSKGNIWVGTIGGVSRLAAGADKFSKFALSNTEADYSGSRFSAALSWNIYEDKSGNIWFGMDGDGVYKYDPSAKIGSVSALTHLTEETGLCDSSIDCIIEDSRGHFWFGSRFGGICRYDPISGTKSADAYTTYSQDNVIGNDEVCAVYEDNAGNIWFSSEGFGVYRIDPAEQKDGLKVTNFHKEADLGTRAPQTIFQDDKGRLWVGGGGGLYRLEGDTFINVRRGGPWY